MATYHGGYHGVQSQYAIPNTTQKLDFAKAAMYGRAFLLQCLGAAKAILCTCFDLLPSSYIHIYHR